MNLLEYIAGGVDQTLETGGELGSELKRLSLKLAKPEMEALGLSRVDPFSTEGQIMVNQAKRLKEAEERARSAALSRFMAETMLGSPGPKSMLPKGSARWSGAHPNEPGSTASPTEVPSGYDGMTPEQVEEMKRQNAIMQGLQMMVPNGQDQRAQGSR